MKEDSTPSTADSSKQDLPEDSSPDSSSTQLAPSATSEPSADAPEGAYALGETSKPQEQVIEQAVIAEDRWYHKLFDFITASANSIFGFALFAVAGFFFYQVLIPGKPKLENEWLAFASTFHLQIWQLPLGVLAFLIFLEFSRRFQWFHQRKRKLQRVPALLFLAIISLICVGLNYLSATSGEFMDNAQHTPYLLADLLFTALTGLALAFGAMIVYSKNEFTKLGYLLVLMGMLTMGILSAHMGGVLRHGNPSFFDKAPEAMKPVLQRAGIGVGSQEQGKELDDQSKEDVQANEVQSEEPAEMPVSEDLSSDDEELNSDSGDNLEPSSNLGSELSGELLQSGADAASLTSSEDESVEDAGEIDFEPTEDPEDAENLELMEELESEISEEETSTTEEEALETP